MIDTTSKLAEALEGLPVEIRDNMILIEENGFHDAQKEGFSLHGRSCPDEIISALTSAGFEAHRMPNPGALQREEKTGFCVLADGNRHEFLIEDPEDEAKEFYDRGIAIAGLEKMSHSEVAYFAEIVIRCFERLT